MKINPKDKIRNLYKASLTIGSAGPALPSQYHNFSKKYSVLTNVKDPYLKG